MGFESIFKEIDYEKDNCLSLEEMTRDGVIYIVRNYSPLMQFLNDQSLDGSYDSDFQSLIEKNKKLLELKRNGIYSNVFLKFLTSNKINYPLSQLDLGFPRIVFPHHKIKEITTQLEKEFDTQEDCFRRYLSPPHRDLNRPHYNRQFNMWWAFHDVSKEESLVFFPNVYKSRVFPYMSNRQLDANAHAQKLSEVTDEYSYEQFGLGESHQVALKKGDFLFFNSEHYHCSPKKVTRIRMSCEMRFVDKSFDNNDHYQKNSFYYLKNHETINDKSGFFLQKKFDIMSKYKQEEVFNRLDDDLKYELISNNKLKFTLSWLKKFKIVLSFKSFYFLEKLKNIPEYSFFVFLIDLRLKKLSSDFYNNHFNFDHNPVNYFIKGHHAFNQPYPYLYAEKIAKKLELLSLEANRD
tara:strand:+ start:915 stop:2135 length:1221 start_codon:yes stop_codon:yes gene_type:complete